MCFRCQHNVSSRLKCLVQSFNARVIQSARVKKKKRPASSWNKDCGKRHFSLCTVFGWDSRKNLKDMGLGS